MERARSPHCWARAALFASTAAMMVGAVAAAYPSIGLDYIYFLPRLLDTFLYQAQNGLSIQWWTPTFGGGLPVFPNPQDLQFSLPQWFTWIANPFVAVCATFAVVVMASCYALHRLARRVLGWDEACACLLAVAGSTGGFMTTRMVVGHVSYHAFALTPVLLLLAMDREIPRRIAIPAAGVVGAYFVYSGGYFVSFAAPLALGMAVPIVCLLAPNARSLAGALGVLAGGGILALALSIARLFAVVSYMSSFPRLQVVEALPSVLSPIVQLVATPLLVLAGDDASPASFHRALFEQSWGVWETDASLALPVVLAALAAFPIALMHVLRTGDRRQRGLAIAASFLFVLVVVLAAARGPVFEAIKHLPGVSNFRVTARFAGALGLPVCLLGVLALSEVSGWGRAGLHRTRLLWAVVAVALLQQVAYVALVARAPKDMGISFDASEFLEASGRLQSEPGKVPPVAKMALVTDPVAVATSQSSLYVYEALLGAFVKSYRPFLQRTPLVAGPAAQLRDGAFNVHFPPAIGYSEHFGLPVYSRIPAADRRNLELFLARRPTGWTLPPAQRVLNAVSLVSAGLTMLWILALLHPRMRGGLEEPAVAATPDPP